MMRRIIFVLFFFAQSLLLLWAASEDSWNPELLVTSEQLEEALRNRSQDIRIIDFGRAKIAYNLGHIPNAVYIDPGSIFVTVENIPRIVAPIDQLVRTFEEAGISNESWVVVYDDGAAKWAARLFWTLEYAGHENVAILDGGFRKWSQEGRKIEHEEPEVARGEFKSNVNENVVAAKEWVLGNMDRPDVIYLDARSHNEYIGQDVRAIRGGHIPNSINLDWSEHFTDSQSFLPIEELDELFRSHGITPDSEILTYCQTGMRASNTYFVLRLLGYSRMRLYDASWVEWGNDVNLPIDRVK